MIIYLNYQLDQNDDIINILDQHDINQLDENKIHQLDENGIRYFDENQIYKMMKIIIIKSLKNGAI